MKKADASGSRRLEPGRYVFAARGGANGVKTSTGAALTPDAAIALAIPNLDLSVRENQPAGGLPPATLAQVQTSRTRSGSHSTGTRSAARTGRPRRTRRIVPAYQAIDGAFPHTEVASIATFEIAPVPAGTAVLTDTGSGQLPFPSDFLLDPNRPVPGQEGRFFVRNIPSLGAAAPGLATLDGFSTTSLMLVPLSGPVLADTITRDNVRVWELAATGPQPLVDVGGGASPAYLTQPPNLVVTQQGVRVSTNRAPAGNPRRAGRHGARHLPR